MAAVQRIQIQNSGNLVSKVLVDPWHPNKTGQVWQPACNPSAQMAETEDPLGQLASQSCQSGGPWLCK